MFREFAETALTLQLQINNELGVCQQIVTHQGYLLMEHASNAILFKVVQVNSIKIVDTNNVEAMKYWQ